MTRTAVLACVAMLGIGVAVGAPVLGDDSTSDAQTDSGGTIRSLPFAGARMTSR